MTATLSAFDSPRARRTLRAVRLVHTGVWLFFVAVILAIPVAAFQRRFGLFLTLTAIVLVEVAVLLANGLSCPLTGIAARYTEDRRDNFDIYLPLWAARYNKVIFGSLFIAGVVFGIVLALMPN